jgi:hypothetical protein
MHRAARGARELHHWSEMVRRTVAEHDSPRTLIRALIDELEADWWG